MILRFGLRTVEVLWKRDLTLFARQKSRIAGSLIQPLLFWLAMGGGFSPTFRLGSGELDYMEYFFPGVVLLVVLMTTLFTTMSVIEDRHQGFLQGVLVAPGSRVSLVLGKCLGSASVAAIQAALFLALAPLAGFPVAQIRWGTLALALGLTAVLLSAAGFAVAWWLDSVQAYHVVMSLVLFPLWILSGAMFPPEGLHPVLRWIVVANPLSYSVAAVRRSLHAGELHAGTGLPGLGAATEILVLAAVAAVAVTLAARVCSTRAPAGPAARRGAR
jgi:daunorubicin resistance ABC transporter membrane protein